MKIWQNQIDRKYDVWVESGADARQGLLVVSRNGRELHREPVTVSHGAIFGVDAQDAQDWIARCCQVVDALPATP